MRQLIPSRFRRSIGARVLAGFGLTAALALAVAVISLIYNRDAGRSLARVTERDREVSRDFRELLVAVELQTGAVQNFLLSGDDRDLEALKMGQERFAESLARLEQRQAITEPGPTFAEIRARATELDDVASKEIALYRQGWPSSANFLWRTEGQDIKGGLLRAINQQIEMYNAGVDADIAESRDYLRFAFAASLAIVALADITAFLIGIGITRAVTGPVRQLVRMAAAVRAGDYSVRTAVTGEDELSVLMQQMNAMTQSLAGSRDALEQALAETARSEERYRLLTEKANDIIFTIDRENRLTFVNPAVCDILGYEPEELIGKPPAMVYTTATNAAVAELEIWSERGGRAFTGVIEAIAKDGHIVPLEINSSVMVLDGEAIGLHGIARDMTERYHMEQELRRLHAQDRRRVDQLVTLNEIGNRIAALQPVDVLLPQLTQKIGHTFGHEHVRIMLSDERGGLSTAASWRQGHEPTHEPSAPASALVLRALEGDAGFVAGSGRPDDDAVTRYTEIAVPIRTASAVLGVLDVRGTASSGLDESDIFTLQILADQVAVAIENARLYETGRRLAVSEERNRLARDLHDSVTQELFSITMIAGALPVLMERKPEVARERLQRLHDLARGALAEMRALLFALRPAALEDEGLVSALRKHAAAFEHRENIKVNLDLHEDDRLPQPVEEALYGVAQEALNNVAKHARASVVDVELAVDDGHALLTISDDGAGIIPTSTEPVGATTLGMKSMRERVELVGGVLLITSAPGEGTTVTADVPLPAAGRIAAAPPSLAHPERHAAG